MDYSIFPVRLGNDVASSGVALMNKKYLIILYNGEWHTYAKKEVQRVKKSEDSFEIHFVGGETVVIHSYYATQLRHNIRNNYQAIIQYKFEGGVIREREMTRMETIYVQMTSDELIFRNAQHEIFYNSLYGSIKEVIKLRNVVQVRTEPKDSNFNIYAINLHTNDHTVSFYKFLKEVIEQEDNIRQVIANAEPVDLGSMGGFEVHGETVSGFESVFKDDHTEGDGLWVSPDNASKASHYPLQNSIVYDQKNNTLDFVKEKIHESFGTSGTNSFYALTSVVGAAEQPATEYGGRGSKGHTRSHGIFKLGLSQEPTFSMSKISQDAAMKPPKSTGTDIGKTLAKQYRAKIHEYEGFTIVSAKEP